MNIAAQPLLELHNIHKSYTMGGETVATLQDVSLRIDPGEFVAIIGPSGSGKSTLMNIVGCLDIPSAGQYMLDGQEVSRLSENKLAAIRNLKIGFIFQSFHLLSKLTALENVELPLIYRGLPAKDRKQMAIDALVQVGLGDRMKHRPTQLSGGQQQRVAIARALAGKPPLLLADEPTGALDTRTSQEVIELIHELHRSGHTVVLITHDPDIAAQAERIIRIADGRLSEGRSAVHEVEPSV